MQYRLKTRYQMIPATLAFLGMLTACAPPPSPYVSNGSNLTLDMRRLQATTASQEQEISKLALQVNAMEIRLQQQEQELERLRLGQQGSRGDYPSTTQGAPAADSASQIPVEGSPTEIYLQAFGDYASGRYQAAVIGFETFLRRFPNNGYASNAQFWLGDCYFNLQQYPTAIQEFEKVIRDYPRAAKSPEALLKIATAQLQLGRVSDARQTVDRLSRQFPKSTAAQKAQELAIP